jgi:hypothetical protein
MTSSSSRRRGNDGPERDPLACGPRRDDPEVIEVPDRFVATDADGLQHHDGYRRRWPLPVRQAGGWRPGEVVEPDENGSPVTFAASELVDALGERVFVAELVGDKGGARLVAATSWSELTAATFALDCVEHVLEIVPGSADAELPGGGTLGAIIASARQYLVNGAGTDTHRLGIVSRIAAARRLRHETTAIGDAAFTAAAQAEGQGVDILSDPACRARDPQVRGARGAQGGRRRRGGHTLGPLCRRGRGTQVRTVVGLGP